MGEAALVTFALAMFSIMNPIGNVGVFASMTAELDRAEAWRYATRFGVAVLITLLASAWFGGSLLGVFGIDVHQLRAAGGVIILLLGLSMLRADDSHRHVPDEIEDSRKGQSAIVPLAIPIVAGPGAIATVVVASEHNHDLLSRFEISLIIFAMTVICAVFVMFSGVVARRIGVSGMGVVSRVMGMVLCAVAVGMLAEGLKGLFPALA